ncbi:hypothetical protein [Actinoplanes sp. NPDC049681]|uniref:hypothetical protein n=1 Tax=Actinoplanes sp. NPDC049681 TaxID=3363905 RepID=UPI0037B9149D
MYSWRGFARLDEIVRIPMIEYLLLAVLVLLIWPFALLGRRPAQPAESAPEALKQMA